MKEQGFTLERSSVDGLAFFVNEELFYESTDEVSILMSELELFPLEISEEPRTLSLIVSCPVFACYYGASITDSSLVIALCFHILSL